MRAVRYLMANPTDITALITSLSSEHGAVRQNARKALVKVGAPAVPRLIELLADPRDHLRWEAAKALSEMGDPRAAPALVQALEDDRRGIRWLAAEGLLLLGLDGLIPLLEALRQSPGSVRLREGAHHVLCILARKGLYPSIVPPVLTALEDIEPAVELPLAVHRALKTRVPVPG